MFSQTCVMHKSFPPTFPPISRHTNPILSRFFSLSSRLTISANSDSNSEPAKPKPKTRRSRTAIPRTEDQNIAEISPITTPKKPRRRGRKSEAAAVEDFVRDSLEQTFASIRKQNLENFEDKDSVMKTRAEKSVDSSKKDVNTEINSDDDDEEEEEDEVVVEEDSESWPIDAEVGYGIRASEYFDQHSIKNVVGEDGVEIDWEGEVDDGWLNEINCLEWESFAFHPSPLIVLVFERYNRASDNWKVLKELEKAAKVYWSAKDRLPPRMVKIDINIERDLAYALKVKEGPQVLFLRGNKILYREKEARTSDELVQMIAHFYYKAKKPSWIDGAALSPPYIR